MKDNKKNRKLVVSILGVAFLLLIVMLCLLFYTIGMNKGRQIHRENVNSETTDFRDMDKNPQEISGAAEKNSEKEKEQERKNNSEDSQNDKQDDPGKSREDNQNDKQAGQGRSREDSQNDKQDDPGKSREDSQDDKQDDPGKSREDNQDDKQDGSDKSLRKKKVSSYAGKLKVVGNQLCTADGKAIQLRGVSTHGLSWFPEYVNRDMFGELKEWGANTVRLALYTAEYNGYCTVDDKNRNRLKETVKKGVQCATEQDLYVIIDWHVLSEGNPNIYKSQAISFFQEMAKLYKDNNHVIYEICNEPNGNTSWRQIKSYAEEVIAAIRKYDSDGVILVGTPTWSQEVDKAAVSPIKGYHNIMYTLHFYAGTHGESLRNTMKEALEDGLPVFVSEFGICDASGNGQINTSQADKWIETMNQYGVSYVAWNLSNKAETSALIKSDCKKTSNIGQNELSDSGKWLLKAFQGDVSKTTATHNKTNTAKNKTPQQVVPKVGKDVKVTAVNSWQEGDALCVQYNIQISNVSGQERNGWTETLTFPEKVTVVSGWNAQFKTKGAVVTLSNMDYNKTIAGGGEVEGIGCIVRIE